MGWLQGQEIGFEMWLGYCSVLKQDTQLSSYLSPCSKVLTPNSHEWPRQNFLLQYQYNINQISDENKEKY